MTEETRRVRLKVGDAEIEVEGDEEFIDKKLAYFESEILDKWTGELERKQDQAELRGARTGEPELGKRPTLREFFQERGPSNNMEEVAVFAFYLKKYDGVEEVSETEIKPCYDDAASAFEVRKPKSIDQALRNARMKKGWFEFVDGKPGYFRLASAGDNFVTLDLPRRRRRR